MAGKEEKEEKRRKEKTGDGISRQVRAKTGTNTTQHKKKGKEEGETNTTRGTAEKGGRTNRGSTAARPDPTLTRDWGAP